MDILECLNKVLPDWHGVVWGNTYEGIKPDDSETRPTPSLEELEAVLPEVETKIKGKKDKKKANVFYGKSVDESIVVIDESANTIAACKLLMKDMIKLVLGE